MQRGRGQKEAARVAEALLKEYARVLKENGKGGDPGAAGSLAMFAESKLNIAVEELDAFANNYVTQGEKLVAASTYSMLNDRYYGQWTVLHTPFRDIAELTASVQEKLDLVSCLKSCS